MRTLILSFVMLFLSLALEVRSGEIAPEKQKAIEKMLRITGTEKLMEQMKTQLMTSFRSSRTGVPEEFWTEFEKKLDMRRLLEEIIPLYDKYYTLEELRAVNDFYESTVGKKVLSTLPQIMQESMKIGQEWGRRVGEQAAAEAERELKQK